MTAGSYAAAQRPPANTTLGATGAGSSPYFPASSMPGMAVSSSNLAQINNGAASSQNVAAGGFGGVGGTPSTSSAVPVPASHSASSSSAGGAVEMATTKT